MHRLSTMVHEDLYEVSDESNVSVVRAGVRCRAAWLKRNETGYYARV